MTTTITAEQACEIQLAILNELKSNQPVLEKIKQAQTNLVIKWQMLIEVLLPLQVKIIQKYGFSPDQNGLLRFNEEISNLQAADPKVRQASEQKWQYVFEQCFNMNQIKQLTLPQAQQLITDIVAAMTSENFLQQIDQMLAKLDPNMPDIQKRQQLLMVLIPLHMSVMKQHGFEGEEGYVQAQRALMDYYHDPMIIQKAMEGQKVIFQRAKLG